MTPRPLPRVPLRAIIACSAFGPCVLLFATLALAADPLVPTLAPDQLHPGDRASVRTVFHGDSIETFDAEILGVLRGGRAEGDLIVARATSEKLRHLGIAAGMSGSPVYVRGKLVGALSSGWTFSRDPIFGITPIGEMLRVLDQPSHAVVPGTAGPTGVEMSGTPFSGRPFGEFRWDFDSLSSGRETIAEGVMHGVVGLALDGLPAPLPLALACGGLSPAAIEPLRSWLSPLGMAVAPGGRAAGGGPGEDALQPGAAVAVDLLTGDLQLSAIGTVTWREGDRVLIFGHPFFQSGEVRLPLSTAEIVTVVASDLSSFKLGVRGRTVGTVTQDRRSAVAGRIGGAPALLPLGVTISGAGRESQRFRFESIEDRTLAPLLTATATLNSLLESGGGGAGQTLDWTLTLYRRGARPLTLSDVAAGDAPPATLLSSISTPLGFLYSNPFARLVLDSLAVSVRVEPTREQWTLRGAALRSATIRPGGTVLVDCEVERWRGGREPRQLRVHVPEEAPDGRYILWLGGGAELTHFEAARLPARYRPTSLEDAWRRLGEVRRSDALYAALYAKAPEVTRDGADYPELPISALALLSSTTSVGDRVRRGDAARLDEERLPLAGLVRGEFQMELIVDSKAP